MNQDFDQTIERFKTLLREQRWPDRLVWITETDALLSAGPTYVRTAKARPNAVTVRRKFDENSQGPWGILLAALCSTEDTTFSYAWIPKDEKEARERLMPAAGGVRLSIPLRPESARLVAVEVKNSLRWMWLKCKYRKLQGYKSDVMS